MKIQTSGKGAFQASRINARCNLSQSLTCLTIFIVGKGKNTTFSGYANLKQVSMNFCIEFAPKCQFAQKLFAHVSFLNFLCSQWTVFDFELYLTHMVITISKCVIFLVCACHCSQSSKFSKSRRQFFTKSNLLWTKKLFQQNFKTLIFCIDSLYNNSSKRNLEGKKDMWKANWEFLSP